MEAYGYNKGKRFSKVKSQSCNDTLLSYEEMNKINNDIIENQEKLKNGFCDINKGKYTMYIPKKTQNKKDVVNAHKRSMKKSERFEVKNQLNKLK